MSTFAFLSLVNDRAQFADCQASLRAIAEPMPEWLMVEPNQHGWNAAQGLNHGLERLTADWIVCIHQDVQFPPPFWRQLTTSLQSLPHDVAVAGIVGCEANGTYSGGAISPGMRMRAKAMNAYSARLPLVDPAPAPALVGTTTETSLEAGIHFGILGELEGTIRRYRTDRPDLAVVLTGGDAVRFSRALESGIFALPFLTLEGYHALLVHHRSLHGGTVAAGTAGGLGTRPAG